MDFSFMPSLLLDWYARSARDLPWRLQTPDPYRTLVSEIMLQQTRVETVKPYYERFIAELPDLPALAAVSEEKLLKLWEGLGYYSRARNLQKAAQTVMREYQGKIPSDREQLLHLPGIGDYTAGAVASIAFGKPEPAVDGNVLRVCARLLNSRHDIADPAFRKKVRDQLRKVYPEGKCSEFTQSIMELGAMICLPGNPRCTECPLRDKCAGSKAGTAPALPVKKAPAARRIETLTVFLLRSKQGRIALRKRPDKGILAGLWEYPSVPGLLTRKDALDWLNARTLEPVRLRKTAPHQHIFTHLEWHMTGWFALCRRESPDWVWTTPEECRTRYSLPGAFNGFKSEWMTEE
ncbi:MAG: A/G-specific adenine glycosylase [Lentisphaeria bacterium]|nr:A/G-specific adenine glycosylase [Lentisphaeria bacterium]